MPDGPSSEIEYKPPNFTPLPPMYERPPVAMKSDPLSSATALAESYQQPEANEIAAIQKQLESMVSGASGGSVGPIDLNSIVAGLPPSPSQATATVLSPVEVPKANYKA